MYNKYFVSISETAANRLSQNLEQQQGRFSGSTAVRQ